MAGLVEKLFTRFGFLEVLARRIAYSNETLTSKISEIQNAHGKSNTKSTDIKVQDGLAEEIFSYIKSLGIKKGDILIVHSSMDGLARTGLTPTQILDFLLSLVGDEGTLVLPAFPIFDVQKNLKRIPVYDPKRTPCWTGLLPNIFCRSYPDVIRSAFPTNSLAAKGKHASEMMKDNLLGDLPHGKHSAWEYCVNHHAKILFLGTKAYHSITLLHVTEDLAELIWPIKDWYETETRKIRLDDNIIEFTFRKEKRFWARFLHEYATAEYLRKHEYLKSVMLSDIPIEFVPDSQALVTHMYNRITNDNYIHYDIPKRYWK